MNFGKHLENIPIFACFPALEGVKPITSRIWSIVLFYPSAKRGIVIIMSVSLSVSPSVGLLTFACEQNNSVNFHLILIKFSG